MRRMAALVRFSVLGVLVSWVHASPRTEFAVGVLEECRGNFAAASLAFERARIADPSARPLVERAVDERLARQDLEGASSLWREFAAAVPDRPDVQLAYADFLSNQSPDDDFAARLACEVLEKTLPSVPDDLPVWERLFLLYERRGLREKSLAVFEEVASESRLNGPRVRAAASMARTLFPSADPVVRGRIDGLFRRAMEKVPEDPVLARAASEHFRTTGRLEEAIGILAAHGEAKPSSLDLRVRRGILLLAAGKEPEGERVILEVLEVQPRHGLAHQSLAKLYGRWDQPGKALVHSAEALKIRGGTPLEFLKLADEFLAVGRPREARLLLEKAVFDHPDHAALLAKLAIAARRDPEGRDDAPRWFREAENLSGGNGPAAEPDFLLESAEVMLEAGQQPAAEERLRQAIRAFPPDRKRETAAALRKLAGLWEKDGRNMEAARALLNRAQALDPSP